MAFSATNDACGLLRNRFDKVFFVKREITYNLAIAVMQNARKTQMVFLIRKRKYLFAEGKLQYPEKNLDWKETSHGF